MQRLRVEPEHVVVVVYHPKKLETLAAKRAKTQLLVARRLGSLKIVDEVATSRNSQVTQDDILESLERWPRAVVVTIGGDGVINTVTHAQMRQDPAERSSLLTTSTGSARDHHYNHNDKLAGYGPLQAYRALRRDPDAVYPMRLRLTYPDGAAETHYANNNFGFNYSADFAQLIDAPAYRQSQLKKLPLIGGFLLDAQTLEQSLCQLSAYESRDLAHGDLSLVDRSLVHAQRAAKHGRFPSVTHRQPDYFFDMHSRHPNRRTVLRTLGAIATSQMRGWHTKNVTFENGEQDIKAHKDGELFAVPAGTHVEVTMAETPIMVHGSRSAAAPVDRLADYGIMEI